MDARGIDVVELLVSDRIRALPARVERPFCSTAVVLVASTCIRFVGGRKFVPAGFVNENEELPGAKTRSMIFSRDNVTMIWEIDAGRFLSPQAWPLEPRNYRK